MPSNPPADVPSPWSGSPAPAALRFGLLALALAGLALVAVSLMKIEPQRVSAMVVALAGLMPLVTRFGKPLGVWLDRIRHPSPRTRLITSIVIAVGSVLFLYVSVKIDGRPLHVRMHDEHSYILQTHMMAAGKLWMPPHPLGDAFQSFHVLVQPLYTSIYFPGTALINVPMVWLHLPHWLIPLLLSGIAVGLVYWNVSQLADGYAAAGCVVLLLGCNVFRSLALMLISQPIMLFLGMVLVALWLQWRHRTGLVWALLLGVVGGLSLIVRPVEALAYCLPIGVAMLWQLGRRRMGRIAITLLLLIVPTIPFVALQIIHNKAITGKALRFASDVFVERYYPGPMVGFSHYDPRFIADTPVVPLREAARSYVGVAYRNHTRSTFFAELWSQRLSRLVYGTMPNVALALLFVIGCAAIGRQQRWVLWAALPLSSLFYVFYVFYIMHYPSVVQPAVGLAIMLSAEVLRRAWPRYRDRIAAGVALAVATAALTNLPQFGGPPDHYNYPQLERINAELAKIDHKPALVIFEFGQYAVLHEEPVYNQDVLWPDDAEVVRVHDLGPELNLKTLEYYAAKQPQRTVYWFSRPRAQLGRLGNVVEVARAGREKLKPPPASSQAMPMPSKVMPTGE